MSNTILKQVALLCALSFTVLSAHALQGDTLIPTQSGNKAIKDIKVGDLVLSKDETTNQMGYQSVTYHHNEEYSQTVYLNVVDEMGNSQTIITNKTHPFFAQTTNPIPSSEGYIYQGDIDGADWVDASNLKVGDKLLSQDGKWQTVQSIKVTNQPLTVYHLTVNNYHTYFATANGFNGVWVHNNGYCCGVRVIGGKIVNKSGIFYPDVPDLRTGRSIPFPTGNLQIVPKANRVIWDNNARATFIKEWHDKGYPRPRGGWEEYDIHHIKPREYGGTNDFWNLTPVQRRTHQQEFNKFWAGM